MEITNLNYSLRFIKSNRKRISYQQQLFHIWVHLQVLIDNQLLIYGNKNLLI
jgi:hypothetical protein